ncbi:MAG: CPBP family intramembrane metalloprotease [Chloroflexi bacterium]|nr:CPBP family intramembrane metalloprotease [Chloroflexota bacterium]MCI0579836.1 CPBP family intramembrane metalloprotease [Chloroflexota bacterium]MCI0646762.1 CPBP family intramembrane metalloprotease [Chloroflexota bacterium]MCI0728985.1 CPBP family intramembrane metalloprotease [Chloroflexota bacterium]
MAGGTFGLRRPASWPRTLLAGIAIAGTYQFFSIGLLVPLLHRLTGAALDLSQFASLRGSLAYLALWPTVSWTLAAFAEEMAYRGYLLNRLADLFGNRRLAWGVGLVVSALFFGLSHIYQGITGVLETFVFGAVMAWLYLVTRRNLWLPIIVHGANDTIGFTLIFFGLYP